MTSPTKELSPLMNWYYDGMGGGFGWAVMIMLMVGFWTLVVLGVVALFRGNRSPDRPRDGVRILDERFARGEIDETEYHARKSVLGIR